MMDMDSGEIREVESLKDQKPNEVPFTWHEEVILKGCRFRIIQICGSPHNTITLQSIKN